MKSFLSFSAVAIIVAALITGCGGGGSAVGIPGTPHPKPTKTPSANTTFNSVQLGLGSSGTRNGSPDCSTTLAPLIVQSTNNFNPQQGQETQVLAVGFDVAAVEIIGNCNENGQTPTYTITDPNIATTTTPPLYGDLGFPNPSPSPGSVDVYGSSVGTTNVVATFPDGSTAIQQVSSYPYISIGCDGSVAYLGGTAWSDTQGTFNGTGDITAICQGSNVTAFAIPNGYELVSAPNFTQSLGQILTALPFVSQGTSLTEDQISTSVIVIFKTNDGKYAKMSVASGCPGCNEMGVIGTSDSLGNFGF